MDIYRENILEHYRNPRNFGKLTNPSISVKEENPLCGDSICMELKISKAFLRIKNEKEKTRRIEDVKFTGEGCAISQASASMLTEKVKGKSLEEIKKIGKEEILKMLGIELSPVRLECALLPLEVLQKAVALV
ncbi:MAG: nitrogen fixation protein NifU [Microgenomates group bacterium LiPW_16]|nr:MAG: nitrogen fixation protein NifU [Microgenomates group bacterium LiPW_16]